MKLNDAIKFATQLFIEKEVEGPKSSAEFLLRNVLKVDKAYLYAHPERELTILEERKFRNWTKRRVKHEPVWYITGLIEFFGQDFSVNTNVLIPRPETEVILEKVTNENSKLINKNVLDIGTGSGTIILTLAKYLPDNNFFASDISEKALKTAKKNAKNFGLNVEFKKGDLFGPWLGKKFDLIVVNLPYVPHEDMGTLAYDLIHYEPRVALDGGENGVVIYKKFIDELPGFINPGAKIYCEIGDLQGDEIKNYAKKILPSANVSIISDYAKHDRLIIIET